MMKSIRIIEDSSRCLLWNTVEKERFNEKKCDQGALLIGRDHTSVSLGGSKNRIVPASMPFF